MRRGDDPPLIQLHRPGNRRSGGRGVETEIVADVVEANHGLNAVDAQVRTELAERDVFRPIALVVLVGRGFMEIVQRPAIHRAPEAALHAGAIRVEVARVLVRLVGQPEHVEPVQRALAHQAADPLLADHLLEVRLPHQLDHGYAILSTNK